MAGEGKLFEKDFKNSAELVEGLSIDRFYDNVGGYAGIKNICDFVVYQKPFQYYVELKSHLGKALPMDKITDYQFSGLLSKSHINGVIAGVIIQYREFNEAYFMNIKRLAELRNEGAIKITIEEARENGVEFPVIKKKRVTSVFDVNALLQAIPKE